MKDTLETAFGLEGKRVVITGGGSGLGFATAECMIAAGAEAVILGRNAERLETACMALGSKAAYFVYDVTETGEAPGIAERIASGGNIDILINNAGVHCKKPVEETSPEDFTRILETHVTGAAALTAAILPYMRKRGQGSVIFISSVSGYIGLTQVSAYGAAKAGLLGLVRILAAETAGDNIRVNAITPGFIETEMFRNAVNADPDRQRKIMSRTPLGRYGSPEDIGWAAVYLSSKAANYITGISLIVDGGMITGF
jgi:gluconate 5-dehydrogenase